MHSAEKRTILLLALFFAPACAAAQAGRPPAPAASLNASFSYATPDGLISRRASLNGDAKLGEVSGFKLRLGAEATHIRTLGGPSFPGELYRTGLKFTAEDARNRIGLDLGSNSDRPYHSPSETDLGLTYSRTFSERGPHAWLWGLNYSTRRSFMRGMPFPFLGYRYTTAALTVVAPFMARWQASKKVAFSASYQPVKYFRLAALWRPLPFFSAELEGGTALEQYLPYRRPDKSDSFFYETSFVNLKPSLALSRRLRLTPSLGWQLGGRHYTGPRYDDRHGETRIASGPCAGLGAAWDF